MSENTTKDQEAFKPEDASYESRYTRIYSDAGFWDKLSDAAVIAGRQAVSSALQIYYTMNQSNMPRWVSVIGLTALGYFVIPSDAIPDAIPAVGYADDLGILVAAADAISTFTTVEINEKAKEKLSEWFAPGEEEST